MAEDEFRRHHLTSLMEQRNPLSVSLYMPTRREHDGAWENRVRYKTLVKRMEDRLNETGSHDRIALVERASEPIEDSEFWNHQEEGLALFISPETFVSYRLPLVFDETLMLSDRFHTKPLLEVFSVTGQFYLLALSLHDVRLFRCSRYAFREIELSEVKESIEEALWYEDPQKQLQYHSGSSGQTGRPDAMYHGQGVGIDDRKDMVLRFMQHVVSGLENEIEERNTPMVVAAVDYFIPMFRDTAKAFAVVDTGIEGNPEGLKPEELHGKAWEIMEPRFKKAIDDDVDRFRTLLGTGRASNDPEAAALAAFRGRVDTLFVAVDSNRWVTFDESVEEFKSSDEQDPMSFDMLDFAAAQTFLKSGRVYTMQRSEMPEEAEVAAIFRY